MKVFIVETWNGIEFKVADVFTWLTKLANEWELEYETLRYHFTTKKRSEWSNGKLRVTARILKKGKRRSKIKFD